MADTTTLPPISQNPNITSQDTPQPHAATMTSPSSAHPGHNGQSSAPNPMGGNTGPITGVVISGDVPKEVRIAQRRARIEARRNERTANGQQQSQPGLQQDRRKKEKQQEQQVEEKKVTESKSYQQITLGQKAIDSVKTNTFNLMTNVMVSTQSREVARRDEDAKRFFYLRQKRDEENQKAVRLNDGINQSWIASEDDPTAEEKQVEEKLKKSPYNIMKLLEKQREACQQLMELKTKIINEYQQELKSKDETYVKELKRQTGDVDTILQRMSEQYAEIRRVFALELQQIERSFMEERNEFIAKNNDEINRYTDRQRRSEANHTETTLARLEEHITLLDELRTKDNEDYNLTKIKLETDVQILEQQLQQMKATYQLNNEKLEYNFQVLKKRDDENNVTITTQKRKLNRLNDQMNMLRSKLAKQEEHYQKEFNQLTEEYKRINEQFKDLQKKFKRFQAMDERKFKDIWAMNEEDVQELLRKVVTADRVLWEQELGLQWKSLKNMEDVLNWHVLKDGDAEVQKEENEEDKPLVPTFQHYAQIMSSPLTRRILDLLTQEASCFLVEEKLQKLLMPLSAEEQSLLKLDSIFKAVGIETVDDVKRLEKYFIKEKAGADKSVPVDENAELIHPNDVVKNIRRFMEDNRANGASSSNLTPLDDNEGSQSNTDEGLHKRNIVDEKTEYWKRVSEVISDRHFNAIEASLVQYNKVLTSRLATTQEIAAIQRQNSELKQLLRQYMVSQINDELQVPPTQILLSQLTRSNANAIAAQNN